MASTDLFLRRYIDLHRDALDALETSCGADFLKWVELAVETLQVGGKILLFGNGGSAAEAQHIATELSIKFHNNRKPLAALALTTDSSAITAAGNDFGFDQIFSRQIAALGRAGDMAVGYSTSGNSDNVINGLIEAQKHHMATIGLTGQSGGKMPQHCDVCIKVPSPHTPHIQEMHNILGHAFCAALENDLNLIPFGDTPWKV